ncbi:Hypothetical protein D9617_2g055170 [Elsinoe fawcettii]|nr:Hypothetical protein D9617_2g055170 [Elsinoe fawcettii]
MVAYTEVQNANKALIASQPLVAVFVGGTSGIGEHAFAQLAATHGTGGKGLRAYIVGRNAQAAAKSIAEARRVCPEGLFQFVQAKDLSLLKDVDIACEEVIKLETEAAKKDMTVGKPRIDLLYMSQSLFGWPPRTDTEEGLGYQMSLLYYSRARCIWQLLPLLLASDLPAHVISIFAAGLEDTIDGNDLSLRDVSNYGLIKVRSHTTFMMTFFMEALARQHPGKLSMVHVMPGLVMTKGFHNDVLPWWFKMTWKIFEPLISFFAFSPVECGQRMLYLATRRFPAKTNSPGAQDAIGTDMIRGSGAYSVQQNGETNPESVVDKKYSEPRAQGLPEQCWDHTTKAFQAIESGGLFTE